MPRTALRPQLGQRFLSPYLLCPPGFAGCGKSLREYPGRKVRLLLLQSMTRSITRLNHSKKVSQNHSAGVGGKTVPSKTRCSLRYTPQRRSPEASKPNSSHVQPDSSSSPGSSKKTSPNL